MLDLESPDIEGANVARILKNHSHTATIPIVGWTGYIGIDHKRSALSAGMVGCLVKPLSLATIARTLDQFTFSTRKIFSLSISAHIVPGQRITKFIKWR